MSSSSNKMPKIVFRGLAEHAQAIGTVCIAESNLEGVIEEFIRTLSCTPDKDDANVIFSNMTIRQKAETLKVLAGRHLPLDSTKDRVIKALDRLCSSLLGQRNRYCHDQWLPKQDDVYKREKRSRVKKSPGSGQRVVSIMEEAPCDVSDIYTLAYDLFAVRLTLRLALRTHREYLELPPEPAPRSPRNTE